MLARSEQLDLALVHVLQELGASLEDAVDLALVQTHLHDGAGDTHALWAGSPQSCAGGETGRAGIFL